MIHKYIANNIIKEYGPADAKQRSFWSTDVPRGTYIVMDYVKGKEGKKVWKRDTKGAIIIKNKIVPIINRLEQDCFYVWKYLSKSFSIDDNEQRMDIIYEIEKLIKNTKQ